MKYNKGIKRGTALFLGLGLLLSELSISVLPVYAAEPDISYSSQEAAEGDGEGVSEEIAEEVDDGISEEIVAPDDEVPVSEISEPGEEEGLSPETKQDEETVQESAMKSVGALQRSPVFQNDPYLSGDCGANGDNVTYKIDKETGVMIITGSGAMKDYRDFDYLPWYSRQEYIQTVAIETGVTHIGAYAFAKCSGLTSITIPDSVTSMGESVFKESALENVTIPDSVQEIPNNAFLRCKELKSVEIGKGVTHIGETAFGACTALENITIPYVTSLGKAAFSQSGLTSLTIPDGMRRIPDNAFSKCDELRSVVIGSGITDIDKDAFYLCKELIDITWGAKVENIGYRAFQESGVSELVFPESVITIGENAFYSCKQLTDVMFGEQVESIGGRAFASCTGLKDKRIVLPASLKVVGEMVFTSSNVGVIDCYAMDVSGYHPDAFRGPADSRVWCPATVVGDYINKLSFCNEERTIGRLTIEDTHISVAAKMEDGDDIAQVTVSGFEVYKDKQSGVADDVEVTVKGTFAETTPGRWEVTLYGWEAKNKSNKRNYGFADGRPEKSRGTIYPASKKYVDISAEISTSREYNGKAYEYDNVQASNSIKAEQLKWEWVSTDGGSYRSTEAPTNAGAYKVTISIDESGYYGVMDYKFVIKKVPLSISTEEDYYVRKNASLPEITLTYDEFVDGENKDNVFKTLPQVEHGVTDTSTTGSWQIKIIQKAEFQNPAIQNYEINYKLGKLTVSEKDNVNQYISFLSGTDEYQAKALTYEKARYTGSSSGEGKITYKYEISKHNSTGTEKLIGGKPVGSGVYTVTAIYEDEDNIGYADVEFTVNKKEVEVDTGNYIVIKEYDGTSKTIYKTGTLEVDGIIAPDDVKLVSTAGNYNGTDVSDDYEIEMKLKLDGASASNYQLASDKLGVPGQIKKATMRIIPEEGQSKVYGEEDPDFLYQYEVAANFSGTIEGWEKIDEGTGIADSVPFLFGNNGTGQFRSNGPVFYGKLGREAGEDVGQYLIELGNLSAGPNYELKLDDTAVYFKIEQATVSSIDEVIDDITMTAYEARKTKTVADIVELAELPKKAAVSTNGGTDELPIAWSGDGLFDPKGASYTATGVLKGSTNINNDNDKKVEVKITVTPVLLKNPVFEAIQVKKNANTAAGASDLGGDILPVGGSVMTEGEEIEYSIIWSAGETIDLSVRGTSRNFTGIITYNNTPNWLTLPEDNSIARMVRVEPKEELTITGDIPDKEYSGSPYAPGTVRVSGGLVFTDDLEWQWESTDGGRYQSTEPPINAGAYKVTISIPSQNEDYYGSVEYSFAIKQATVSGIVGVTDEITMTAYEARNAKTVSDILKLVELPDNVSVITSGGTGELPITWSGEGEFNPKGASYKAKGMLSSDGNINNHNNIMKTVSIVVTPTPVITPVLGDIQVKRNTNAAAGASDLGEDILPVSGSVMVEGVKINYSITWSADETIDLTVLGANQEFIGTITYHNVPDWMTLPETNKITRTVRVESKEKVTITGDISDQAYSGSPYTPGTVSVSGGLVLTDDLEWQWESTDDGGYQSTEPPINAGAYKVTISVPSENADYYGSVEYFFVISKGLLTVIAPNQKITVGDRLPEVLILYEGFVGDDDENKVFATLPVAGHTVTNADAAGEFAIEFLEAGQLKQNNYDVTYVTGVLTIIKGKTIVDRPKPDDNEADKERPKPEQITKATLQIKKADKKAPHTNDTTHTFFLWMLLIASALTVIGAKKGKYLFRDIKKKV